MPRNNICAYCGNAGPETKDHIPPKRLFPEPLPSDLITVPCCQSCREGWSTDDEYFKTIILTSMNLKGDGRAKAQLKSAARALTKPNKVGFAMLIKQSMIKVDIQTKAGIIIGQQPALKYDRARIERVLNRIVRGLFFKENSVPVPADCKVESFIDQFGKDANATHESASFPPAKWAAGKMFLYTYLKAEDNPNISVWLGAFYERVSFIGFTGLNYIPREEYK